MKFIRLNLKDKGVLLSVCLVVFIDSIGLGLIFPILPTLFTVNNYGLLQSEPQINSNYLYAIAISLYPFASLLGMPILGRLSDIFGRRKLLLWAVAGSAIGYALSIVSLFTHNISLFFISRFVSGFSSGTYSICGAAIVDLGNHKGDKVTELKFMTLAMILGFIIGPGLSYFIHESSTTVSLATPFILACGLCLLNIILLYIFYPFNQSNMIPKQTKIFGELTEALKFMFKANIRYLIYGYLLFNLGFEIFLQSQSLYLKTVYSYSAKQIGLFFVIMGSSFALSMFVIHPKVNKILAIKSQIKSGVFIMGLGLLLYAFLNMSTIYSMPTQIKFTWINSIFFYLATPFVTLNMTKVFSDIVSNDSQGNLMGALGQISSIATVVGALAMGVFFAITPDLNAVCGGFFILAGAFILRALLKNGALNGL